VISGERERWGREIITSREYYIQPIITTHCRENSKSREVIANFDLH
jgi:hypothetical protein